MAFVRPDVLTLRTHRCILLLSLLTGFPAWAQDHIIIFHGKVTLEDGSPPGHSVLVQRVCEGSSQPTLEGMASAKTGEYFARLHLNDRNEMATGVGMYAVMPCVLEASDKGFISSRIDLTDRRIMADVRFPNLVLIPRTSSTILIDQNLSVPHAASRNWDQAIKLLTGRTFAEAEKPLKSVVEAAPKFAAGWAALGVLYNRLAKPDEARQALERAVEIDPKPLPPWLALAIAEVELRDWKAAADTAQLLIGRDTRHAYVEAYNLSAIALYQSEDFDNALARIKEGLRYDKLRELTRAEYIQGLIYEAKGDYAGAAQHLSAYIQQHPHAKDIGQVTERIANLGKRPRLDLASELTSLDMSTASVGLAPVPGGIQAFSRVAQLKEGIPAADFFLEYCRALTESGSAGESRTLEASEEVKEFISAIPSLEALGAPREDGTQVRIAFGTDAEVRRSRAILAELGLKLVARDNGFTIDPGELRRDGLRQSLMPALGVDEFDLRQAVRRRQEFTFPIAREDARLTGGPAWDLMLKGVPDMPGGPIEAFTQDGRFSRVYGGLGAMDSDSAAAVVSAIGMENLIVRYSRAMADYGDAIVLEDQHVAVPGGANAEPIWATLAGARPETPARFLRALFGKDGGLLLAFYYDLMHADAAHRQYFMQTSARAEAWYKWFREEAMSSLPPTPDRWQARILQALPVDSAGKLVLPGGSGVWQARGGSEDDAVLHTAPAQGQALAALIDLERKRGAPLTAADAQILAKRYAQWRNLFPYFEKLPALAAADYQALADFTDDAARAPPARRNLLTGEWHSLVELIVLGVQAGSLDNGQAETAFRQACQAMRSPNPSAAAVATLSVMTGNAADLDEALATQLLRLSGARREAFENVKRLQKVPLLSAPGQPPDAAATLAALGGNVYAAVLNPAYLLVAEDPQLLSKHNYSPRSDLFAGSTLEVSSSPPGTRFSGGFASFQEAAQVLQRQTIGEYPAAETSKTAVAAAPESGGPGELSAGSAPADDPVFRAGGRLVEIYATATDSRGRYVDDLQPVQFRILEEGQIKPVFAFENQAAGVSVTLLFDTTGSMVGALPPLKSAALQLVDDLRDNDSVAVYSFSDTVNELQPFTSDKDFAKRAILKTHAYGMTAVYDALVRVNRDLAGRGGKKVIIVFTDGSDNSSMLSSNTAIERARTRGIPIYTIAEGEALQHSDLMAELNRLSQSTGGEQFLIHKLDEIGPVFDKVAQDLMHGYLLAFQPSPSDDHSWRRIKVVLNGTEGLQVRARDGFNAE